MSSLKNDEKLKKATIKAKENKIEDENEDEIEDKSIHSIEMNQNKIIFLIKINNEIEDYNKSLQYIDELLILNDYQLSKYESNIYMITIKKAYKELYSKLKRLKNKEMMNNPNIITLFIKESLLTEHISNIENELRELINKVIDQVQEILEKIDQTNIELLIFIQMLKADFLRYLIDLIDDEEDKIKVEYECQTMYQSAYELCNSLPVLSPITLTVILNYSVFLYYINNDIQLAYEVADSGFRNAVVKLKGDYKSSINKLLKQIDRNLQLWMKEMVIKKVK